MALRWCFERGVKPYQLNQKFDAEKRRETDGNVQRLEIEQKKRRERERDRKGIEIEKSKQT